MPGKDLGTWHVRVKFRNGSGFIQEWSTGARYGGGTEGTSPLGERRIEPSWKTEEDVLRTMFYMFTEGNYSCDCNRRLFLDWAAQRERPENGHACGNELELEELTAIAPDGREIPLFVFGFIAK